MQLNMGPCKGVALGSDKGGLLFEVSIIIILQTILVSVIYQIHPEHLVYN